jgi:molecular chaperone DnaJ
LGDEGSQDLDIPSGTQPGEILSLPGFGMPSLQRKRRGNLFVKLSVKIPKKLNAEQKELLEAFAASEGIKKNGAKSPKTFWQKIKKT